jgi:hypothetical protein
MKIQAFCKVSVNIEIMATGWLIYWDEVQMVSVRGDKFKKKHLPSSIY